MNENKHLFDTKISELQKDTFYRQRFDACPHFMAFIGEAHTSITNHSNYPYGQINAYCKFVNDRADWYHSNLQLKKTASVLLHLLKKDIKIIQDIKDYTYPKIKYFYKCCKIITKMYLKKLDDKELVKEYAKLKNVYLQKLYVSALIDGFSLATDKLIHKKIKKALDSKDADINKVFEKLTAHTFISFLQEEEVSLLEIEKTNLEESQRKSDAISSHQRKYFWIQNNYVDDNILQIEFFEQRLNLIDKKKVNQRIIAINNLPKKHKKTKEKLYVDLKISEDIKSIIALTDIFNYLQDERKKSTFWATHYFSLFLDELANRVSFKKDNLRYSLPSEFESIIKGEIEEKTLSQRKKDGCVVLWYKDEYQTITDKQQIKILDSLTDMNVQGINIIKGFVASRGIVSGNVRLVESVKDIHKVNVDDIIVTVMTRPDYFPAMQKASAFITDEGGVTCHASIIAREMKKPCIIGTKIATKVLKNGDLIKVDANNGIVSILKKVEE